MKSLLCELQCVTFVTDIGNRSKGVILETDKFSGNRSFQRPAARHDHRPLNEILQFTNTFATLAVSSSAMAIGEISIFLLHSLVNFWTKNHSIVVCLPAFLQRRYADRKYMQAVVQIGCEFVVLNHLFEVAIGCRDQAEYSLFACECSPVVQIHALVMRATASG